MEAEAGEPRHLVRSIGLTCTPTPGRPGPALSEAEAGVSAQAPGPMSPAAAALLPGRALTLEDRSPGK